jgi:hypothetical protein
MSIDVERYHWGDIRFALKTWFPRQGLVRENHSSRALDGDPENRRGCRLSSTKITAHWPHLSVSFSVISTFSATFNARDVSSLHVRHRRASDAETTNRPTSNIATTSFNVTFACRSSVHAFSSLLLIFRRLTRLATRRTQILSKSLTTR